MWVSAVLLLGALVAVQGEGIMSQAKKYASNLFNPYIVGGTEASPHQFPWQALIYISKSGSWSRPKCGGTLIHPNWIVTAAHCTRYFEEPFFEVILGAHDLRNESETTRQYIHAATHYTHEEYDDSSFGNNDIALIELPFAADLDEYVQTIRLPTKERKSNTYKHKQGIMSGWGVYSDNSTDTASVLTYVKSNILSNWNCRARYGFMVKSSKICVSGLGGKGTCNGDSGGPLVVYENDGKPTLVGVTSHGTKLGCESGWAPAFSRVTSYVDWIEKTTGLTF